MSDLFSLLKLLAVLAAVLVGLFVVAVSMPQSKLRDVLMPFAKVGFALACGIYVASPFDVMPEAVLGPFGLGDDIIAGITGFTSACCGVRDGLRLLKD